MSELKTGTEILCDVKITIDGNDKVMFNNWQKRQSLEFEVAHQEVVSGFVRTMLTDLEVLPYGNVAGDEDKIEAVNKAVAESAESFALVIAEECELLSLDDGEVVFCTCLFGGVLSVSVTVIPTAEVCYDDPDEKDEGIDWFLKVTVEDDILIQENGDDIQLRKQITYPLGQTATYGELTERIMNKAIRFQTNELVQMQTIADALALVRTQLAEHLVGNSDGLTDTPITEGLAAPMCICNSILELELHN